MKVNWKDIVFLPYTRSVSRQVNEKLLEGVIVSGAGVNQTMDVPAINADHSEQLLVELMTWLSPTEVDALTVSDYDQIKAEIQKIIQGEKK